MTPENEMAKNSQIAGIKSTSTSTQNTRRNPKQDHPEKTSSLAITNPCRYFNRKNVQINGEKMPALNLDQAWAGNEIKEANRRSQIRSARRGGKEEEQASVPKMR